MRCGVYSGAPHAFTVFRFRALSQNRRRALLGCVFGLPSRKPCELGKFSPRREPGMALSSPALIKRKNYIPSQDAQKVRSG